MMSPFTVGHVYMFKGGYLGLDNLCGNPCLEKTDIAPPLPAVKSL